MTSVVFIDRGIEYWETLAGAVGPDTRVVLLDPEFDGVSQMAAALYGVTGLDAIHILSHGSEGALNLGST